MNQDLVDELNYMIDLLAKSGFFSEDEIIEILEDQFIDEDIDFSKLTGLKKFLKHYLSEIL